MISWLLFNIHTLNLAFALSGLLLLVCAIGLILDYRFNNQKLYKLWLESYAWLVLVGLSIASVATTLLYSEVFGFIPCSLCWLQRVALYSLALISIAAYIRKDTLHFPIYGVVLSTFGFIVAVYQYIYQALPQSIHDSGLLPCLADGSADCSKKIMEVFGFITFPFLSAVIFLFLIALFIHLRKQPSN